MAAEEIVTEEAHRASVHSRILEDSKFDWAYVVMNVLATVVACYGLLENSAAVVIGAMIIAMLLGPISGLGLALVTGDNRLFARAFATLAGGVLLVFVTAFLIGWFHRQTPVTAEMMARTSPDVYDLMIALGGGAAGAYATTNRRLNAAFVGVAIATALVPPLATSSMFLARGEFAPAGGAFLLAFANIVGIQFACSAVFLLSGFRKAAFTRTTFMRDSLSIGMLLVLGVLLTINLRITTARQLYESSVRSTLRSQLLKYPGAYLEEVRFARAADSIIVRAVVRGPESFSASQVADMESSLPRPHVHTSGITGPLCAYNGDEFKRTALFR